MKKGWRYFAVSVLSFCVVGIYALAAFNLKVFNPVAEILDDYSFTDFYYKLLDGAAQRDTSHIVTIIDMTELTSRRDLADLFMEVHALHPKAVGVDIVFEGYKEDVLGDTMIAVAARTVKNFVFSYKIIDGEREETVHSFFMPNDSIIEGFTNMPRQLYGGMKRSLSIGRTTKGELRPSFLKKVSEIYAGQEIVPLADKDLNINFSPTYFHVVPYDAVLENRDLIEDRLVLIGAMKEENDMHYTPQGKIAGVELLAYGTQTLLRQTEIKTAPTWLVLLLSFLLTLITAIWLDKYKKFTSRKKNLFNVLLSTSLIKGLILCAWVSIIVWITFILFCKYNYSISLAYGLSAIAFIYMGENLYDTIRDISIFKKEKKNEK